MFFKPGSGSADLTQVTGALGVTHAGTGLTGYAIGDMLFAHAADGLTRLAKGANGDYLKMSASLIPTWTAQAGNLATFYLHTSLTITSSGTLVLAHGLAAIPSLFQLRLVCTADDGGYVAGKHLIVNSNAISNSAADNKGAIIQPDSTNINVIFGGNASVFATINPSTSAGVDLDNSKWKLYLQAWK